MKLFLVVLLLVMFSAAPLGALRAEPFCDIALESAKVVDWLVCQVFAGILNLGSGDYQGNWTIPWE